MQTQVSTNQVIVPPQIPDKAAELKKQVIEQLREVSSDPTMFSEFMKFIRRFHNYSLYNRILIFYQRRNASQVAGYHTWISIGRQVRKGETGIAIFAPRIRKVKSDDENDPTSILTGFRIAYVFDYEQTFSIDPAKEDVIPSFGKLIVDDPEIVYEKMKFFAEDSGIQVIETVMEFAKAGATNGQIIKINKLTGVEARCSTILHELAHVFLKHSAERRNIPRYQKEIEAELTAFLVGMSLGLPKGNYEYIQGWLQDEAITDEAIEQAIKTSDILLGHINCSKEPTIN